MDFMQENRVPCERVDCTKAGTETVDHVDGSIPLWKILSKVTQEWDFSLQNDKE